MVDVHRVICLGLLTGMDEMNGMAVAGVDGPAFAWVRIQPVHAAHDNPIFGLCWLRPGMFFKLTARPVR